MPHQARSHTESRSVVCLLCMGKGKDHRGISDIIQSAIRQFLIDGYDPTDERLPTSICSPCRITLLQYQKGDFSRHIALFDHSIIGAQSYQTRSQAMTKCACFVCEKARNSSIDGKVKKVSGRPNEDATKPLVLKLCSRCLSSLHPGKQHNCSHTSRVKNITQLAAAGSENVDEKVVACILKSKTGSTSLTEIDLNVSGGGHALKVIVSPVQKSSSRTLFSGADVMDMQQDLHLSGRETLKLGKHLRAAASFRNTVEPNLKKKLHENNHKLDDWFEIKFLDFVKKEKNVVIEKTPRWTVVCNDVDTLIQHIIKQRNYTDDGNLIRIGIDGGRGFLKVCLSVFPLEHQHDEVVKEKYKDSSVKRIFIIGIAPDVQENYENMLMLWASLNLQKITVDFTIATDLKLCNILLGIMSHGALHPCCWCNVHKSELRHKGEERTLRSLKQNFWQWNEEGERRREKAKNYNNVVHPSLIKRIDLSTKVLEVVPPPELHLFLGPVNAIYCGLAEAWDGIGEWIKACHVEREAMFGGSFTGNSCRTLLSKIDLLRSMCPLDCLKFVDAFSCFSKVVSACYGDQLDPNFRRHIQKFQDSYATLGINVTPKVHAVFHHVGDFCELHNRGLGPWSEQSSEAVHHDFSVVWEDFKVKSCHHPDFCHRLLRAVSTYNSRHL